MSSNLLTAAGVSYAITGALLLLLSRFSSAGFRRAALPHYRGVLARASAARLDRRFAVFFLCIGVLGSVASRYGWSAPMSFWRYPAVAALAVLLLWSSARLLTFRPVHRKPSQAPRRSPFDTRRSLNLRQAAEREMAGHMAREIARGPRDTGVVYLRRRWDRHWWSARLNASVEDIEAAVSRVGPMRHDVERYLAALRSGPTLVPA